MFFRIAFVLLKLLDYETANSKQYEHYVQLAYEQALKSYNEGGCPIGGVLVDNDTGQVLGVGHNALVQENNPIIHGEMAAMRNAGRLINRHNTTMYTTLVPCFMCTGTIAQFGIPRVVIADATNSTSRETIEFLEARGVEVIVMDSKISKASQDCIDLVAKFKKEKPELWLEDWGGGKNPDLCKPGVNHFCIAKMTELAGRARSFFTQN